MSFQDLLDWATRFTKKELHVLLAPGLRRALESKTCSICGQSYYKLTSKDTDEGALFTVTCHEKEDNLLFTWDDWMLDNYSKLTQWTPF